MKSTEIFNDYDMVVSVTQRTINDQLTHLMRLGVIQPQFIVVQDDKGFTVLDSPSQIPMNPGGKPKYPFINAKMWPQIAVSESGVNVTFILNFLSGTACFWDLTGSPPQLKSYDMTGWKYGINITLDLKAVEQADIGKRIKVPDLVKQQLHNFMSNMFQVNHLFLDFESTDLVRYDPNHTDTKDAGDQGLDYLALFMQHYLNDLVKKGNPYILGYSLTTSDSTKYQPDQNVPDVLKPVGTTYTMYHDPDHQDLSTVNFVLVTKGGHSGILGSPGNFDTNWIRPDEQCNAKMIYSHSRLIEHFILEPFFNQLSAQVHSQIKDHISVPQGNAYAAAKVATQTGFKYTISNVAQGNDQYVNWFTVDIHNDKGQADLEFKGHIKLYKEVHKNLGIDLEADASGFVDWSGTVSIKSTKDAKGNPTLAMQHAFRIDNHDSRTHASTTQEVIATLLAIVKKVGDVISSALDTDFFRTLIDLVLDQIAISPEIGNLAVVMGNLGNSLSTVLLLPAGQEFFFKNPAADSEANLYLELTYKSDTSMETPRLLEQEQSGQSTQSPVIKAMDESIAANAAAGRTATTAVKSEGTITPVNPPAVDKVVLPAIGHLNAKEVSFQVSCELMKNQQKGSPISPTRDIRVVQDNLGRPLIFTIGTDRKFQLLKSELSANGWKALDLSGSFTDYESVQTFDVTQDLKGRISVAVAMTKKGTTGTDIFVASILSGDEAKTNWSKFADFSKRLSGVDPFFVAEQIRMGTSDIGEPPLIVISGNIGGQKYYYQSTDINQGVVKLEFPENVNPESDSMMDLALGYAFGQRGTFFLYKAGETQTLECTTLPDPNDPLHEGPQHYDYSPGNAGIPPELRNLRYNCIATPTGSQTDPTNISSDIYVGANSGIYVFRNGNVKTLQKVTDRIADVHEVLVRQDNDNISVWAVCSPNKLYYIAGKKGTAYTWNSPILFSQSVVHVAPIRSISKQSNELILVNQDLSISHCWQDRASTLWQRRTIKVVDKNYLLDFDSFTTQIHLEDQDGNPLANQVLRITASEWTYVTANGLVYSLDLDNAAEIETDVMGNVTIITMATDISTPILHVQGDFFAKTLNIYPNGKIQKGLSAIRKGDDLKNARTKDGKPVLTQSYDPATLDGVATNINRVTTASTQYLDNRRSGTNVFVCVEEKGVKDTGVLNVAHLASDFAVGMTLKNGQWQLHTDALKATAGPGDIIHDFIDLAGDALHWIETEFDEGIKLVEQGLVYLKDDVNFVIKKVEEGLMFVLTVGKNVLNVALKTLGSVFKILNWILKQIGIALKDILAWLGHLFGWDDIWDTHKIIASMVNNSLEYAIECADTQIDRLRASIKEAFGGIEEKLNGIILSPAVKGLQPRALANANARSNSSVSWTSPQTNFVAYQVQHGGMLESGGEPTVAARMALASTGNPFMQFIADVVEPALSAFLSDFEKDIEDLKRLCSDPSQTLENVLELVKDLVATVLDPVAAIIDGFLKFAIDLLHDVKGAIEGKIPIPFLSDFYEFITDLLGDKEKFTFVNGIALLLAIPMVEVCKIVTGSAPFAHGTYGLKDPQLFTNLIGPPSNPGAAFPKAGRVTSVVAAPQTLSASPTDDWYTLAHHYSKWGALAAAISVFLQRIFGGIQLSSDPVADPNQISFAKKAQLLFVATKFAGTIPLPKRDPNDREIAAYILKGIAYLTAAIQNIIIPFLPSKIYQGLLLAGGDLVVLALSLPADAIGEMNVMGGLTLATDIVGNGSGIAVGSGTALMDKEGVNPVIRTIGGALVATGTVGTWVAAVLTGVEVFLMDEGYVLHAVNVGG
jgi:hypothetical protein